MKSNLNLDKLQTTFSSPSLVIPLFLPIDIHPTLAKGNPRSELMHTHNPRVGSDLRNYLPLTGNLSMQEFCFLHSDNYIWDRKECKLLIDLFFLCRMYENDWERELYWGSINEQKERKCSEQQIRVSTASAKSTK